MKKIILIVAICFICNSTAWAGFSFGVDTYEKIDDILIVNSLGDKVAESQFNYNGKNLGYNDYIPENAFKNNLYNDGYSVVYDSKPVNINTVNVEYMGRLGNPKAIDVDYVLEKEWKQFSAQYQDVRIENNKDNIINNTNKINLVNNKHTTWNNKQDKKINKNTKKINKNTKKINKNTTNIKKNSKQISNNSTKINNEVKNRKQANEKITKINNKQTRQIKKNKTTINNEIDNRVSGDNILQNNINTNTTAISNNSNRITDVNNRVNALEETQYRVDAEIQIYDDRNLNFSTFINSDIRHSRVDAVGIKFTYKLGKDYAVKRMEELERKIDKYIELKENENSVEILKTSNGFRLNKKF